MQRDQQRTQQRTQQSVHIAVAPGKKDWIFELLLLAAIILAGLFLRFYKLGEWSLWGDEIFTLSLREDGFNYSIWRKSLASLLIQWTAAGMGPSEWSARLAPALIGVVSILVLFFPIRKLFGTAAGLIASGLLAVSTWHIYWSQNARFYILLLLFYSLALLAFHHGIEEDRPLSLILSLIFLGLAARERLLALFLVPVVAAYLVLLKILPFPKPPGLRLRNVLIYFGPLIILALLFAGPYLRNYDEWMKGFGTANNSPIWLLAGVVYYMGIPAVLMGGFGALFLLWEKNRSGLLLGLSAVLPLLLLMAIAPFHYTANRYVFIILTSWVWLASLAVIALFEGTQGKTRILAAGLLAVLLMASLSDDLLYYRYQNGNRENWKAAYAYIEQHRQEGDRVINKLPDLGTFYLHTKTYTYPAFRSPETSQDETRIWFIEDMESAWLYPQVHGWMREHAREVAEFDVYVHARNFRMRVYLYDPQIRDLD